MAQEVGVEGNGFFRHDDLFIGRLPNRFDIHLFLGGAAFLCLACIVITRFDDLFACVDDKSDTHVAVHDARHQACHGAGQTTFQPVAGVFVAHANGERAVFVGDYLRISHPCVKRGLGHLHLKLPKCRLPGLFCVHDSYLLLLWLPTTQPLSHCRQCGVSSSASAAWARAVSRRWPQAVRPSRCCA